MIKLNKHLLGLTLLSALILGSVPPSIAETINSKEFNSSEFTVLQESYEIVANNHNSSEVYIEEIPVPNPILDNKLIPNSPSNPQENLTEDDSLAFVKGQKAKTVCGIVSHYSPADSGSRTASGIRVRSGIVAHKSLPFGSKVIIKGRRYVVMDRGPYIAGRVFDIWVPNGASRMGTFRTCAKVYVNPKKMRYIR